MNHDSDLPWLIIGPLRARGGRGGSIESGGNQGGNPNT